MPKSSPTPANAGTLRARLRLGAVVLLSLLALLYLGLAARLVFFATASVVTKTIIGLLLAAVGLGYGVLARLVLRQSRAGHIVAIVLCVAAAVLSIVADMAWPDWLALGSNLLAAGLLLGCVPRKEQAPPL